MAVPLWIVFAFLRVTVNIIAVMYVCCVIQLTCNYSFVFRCLVVNAVVAGKFSLVTASSDHTARLWVKEKCVKTLQG